MADDTTSGQQASSQDLCEEKRQPNQEGAGSSQYQEEGRAKSMLLLKLNNPKVFLNSG